MNYKKVLAVVLAASMTVGSSVMAFAGEPETPAEPMAGGKAEGEGIVEGIVGTDIFDVVLPTVEEADAAFNFILDPEQLLPKAGEASEKYEGAKFTGTSGFFFKTTDKDGETAATYTADSRALKITNKSTGSVSVDVTATVTGNTVGEKTIDLVETLSTATAAKPEIMLTLSDTGASAVGTGGTDASVTVKDVSGVLKAEIKAAEVGGAADQYETVLDGNDNYIHQLKSTATINDFKSYTFKLTGACNTEADWTGLEEAAPKVTVTWGIDPKGWIPSVSGPSAVMTDAGLVTISNLPEGVTVDKTNTKLRSGEAEYPLSTKDTVNYADGGCTIQLGAGWFTSWSKQAVTITVALSDGKTVTATATLK